MVWADEIWVAVVLTFVTVTLSVSSQTVLAETVWSMLLYATVSVYCTHIWHFLAGIFAGLIDASFVVRTVLVLSAFWSRFCTPKKYREMKQEYWWHFNSTWLVYEYYLERFPVYIVTSVRRNNLVDRSIRLRDWQPGITHWYHKNRRMDLDISDQSRPYHGDSLG